jgi:hypothetical protein
MAAMQVEVCFHCTHHMETDRDRSLRTVLLANEIRKRKRQPDAPLVLVAPVAQQQQQQPEQQQESPKRRRIVLSAPAPEEKERAKRSSEQRRVRLTVASASSKRSPVGTAAAPIVVEDEDDEVIESGHIKAAVREVAAQQQHDQQQQVKRAIAAGLEREELHAYDLYFSKESLGAIVGLVSGWIRVYDQKAYATFTREEREKWIISLVQMIVQILNWRLNNFFSSYSQCFKIESFPNLFSKNFKADTSRVGVDKLAKKWQKRNYELLLATLMYADRYVRARGLKDIPLFHLLAVSSLCTIKHWLEERNRHANRLFADVLSLTVRQVNALERTFLSGLDYSLSLSPEDFPQFLLAQMTATKRV